MLAGDTASENELNPALSNSFGVLRKSRIKQKHIVRFLSSYLASAPLVERTEAINREKTFGMSIEVRLAGDGTKRLVVDRRNTLAELAEIVETAFKEHVKPGAFEICTKGGVVLADENYSELARPGATLLLVADDEKGERFVRMRRISRCCFCRTRNPANPIACDRGLYSQLL